MASTLNADPYDPTYIPQRTSLMAILALVLGIACLPGLGVLAVIFGIASIIAISNARGRLIGTGMAVTGVVLGLLFSVIWIGLGIGANQARNALYAKVITPTNEVISSFDATGDPQIIRNLFSPAVSATISDAQIIAFRDAYRAETGAFKSVPNGFMEAIRAYSRFGQQMQKYQTRPGQQAGDVIPVPAEFEKGWVLLILRMDMTRTGGPSVQFPSPNGGVTVRNTPPPQTNLPLIDIAIETISGKTIRLSEMPGGPAPVDGAKATDALPADAKPAETKPAEPKPGDVPVSPDPAKGPG